MSRQSAATARRERKTREKPPHDSEPQEICIRRTARAAIHWTTTDWAIRSSTLPVGFWLSTKREVHSSLRGRVAATVIRPFSCREFLRHRGEEPAREPAGWTAAERSLVEKRFREFLTEGGFPEAQGTTRGPHRSRRGLERRAWDPSAASSVRRIGSWQAQATVRVEGRSWARQAVRDVVRCQFEPGTQPRVIRPHLVHDEVLTT